MSMIKLRKHLLIIPIIIANYLRACGENKNNNNLIAGLIDC